MNEMEQMEKKRSIYGVDVFYLEDAANLEEANLLMICISWSSCVAAWCSLWREFCGLGVSERTSW
jgi:hypothetical protein